MSELFIERIQSRFIRLMIFESTRINISMRIARMLLRSTGCSDYYANEILRIVGHKLICRTGCVLEGLSAIPFSVRVRTIHGFISLRLCQSPRIKFQRGNDKIIKIISIRDTLSYIE